ncbi:MAG: DUF3014 domain-containing protein [Methyloversatilis sp.]|nr:DUF3014 domain-containing protein [Methyloversatilis sp.]
MTSWTKGALVVVVLAGAAALYTYMQKESPPADAPPVAVAPSAKSVPAETPVALPNYPITPPPDVAPATPSAAPVDSDAVMRDGLGGLFGASFDKYFSSTDIVRRIVVTVDNLPRERVTRRLMPVKPLAGPPVTAGSGDTLTLDATNSARYDVYVQLAEMVPTAQLVDLYVRHYPLFQQQYVELGYPNGYFNNRLVEVIDHLLATPVVPAPIRLKQPKVLYTFADPELEKLSEGQKMMLRMGEANAERIRAKLTDIRAAVTRQP